MTVEQLIKRLQGLPPETVVVKCHSDHGYDECWFIDGTHTGHDGEGDFLRINWAERRRKGGEPVRPDYVCRDPDKPSRAKRIPYVVIA